MNGQRNWGSRHVVIEPPSPSPHSLSEMYFSAWAILYCNLVGNVHFPFILMWAPPVLPSKMTQGLFGGRGSFTRAAQTLPEPLPTWLNPMDFLWCEGLHRPKERHEAYHRALWGGPESCLLCHSRIPHGHGVPQQGRWRQAFRCYWRSVAWAPSQAMPLESLLVVATP